MSDRTEKLAKIDQWRNLRERFFAGWCIGTSLSLAILIVTDGEQEQATGLPLSIIFAGLAGLATAFVALVLGMVLRWPTLSRRLTLPLCSACILCGLAGSIYCLMLTIDAPRTPIGTTDLQHAPLCLAGLGASVFGAVHWPNRPRR